MSELSQSDINQIIKIESEIMLQDALITPMIIGLSIDKNINYDNALNYISNIFKELFRVGNLKIIAYLYEGNPISYAMVIHFPGDKFYLHRIYVEEKYRMEGIGSLVLSTVKERFSPICFISSIGKEHFFEKNGFNKVSILSSADAKKTQSLSIYKGLTIMSNKKKSKSCQFFFLDDDDFKEIRSLLLDK
jgi:GNAT superfamily N-acetyltransferase